MLPAKNFSLLLIRLGAPEAVRPRTDVAESRENSAANQKTPEVSVNRETGPRPYGIRLTWLEGGDSLLVGQWASSAESVQQDRRSFSAVWVVALTPTRLLNRTLGIIRAID